MLTKVIEQAKIDRFARWMGHAERIVIVAHVAPGWRCHRLFIGIVAFPEFTR